MGRYRSRLEIIADVLGVVRDGARKTRIMYQANLSYELLTRYLEDVVNMGLVSREDAGFYELTEKGFGFLQEFKGYHEKRVKIEEQLNDVEEKKVILENRFLNSKDMKAGSEVYWKKAQEKSVDASLKNYPSKKNENKRGE